MTDQDMVSTAVKEVFTWLSIRAEGLSPGEVDADDLLRLQRVVGPPSSVLGPVPRHEAEQLDGHSLRMLWYSKAMNVCD